MEEKLSILEAIKGQFGGHGTDIRTYSPLALAYIGDAIYDLIIRTVIVERTNRQAGKMHREAVRYVNAGTQARMAEALEETLEEDEKAVYHRGRNAKPHTSAKNASLADYRKATGLEALFGYLYLQGKEERILTLIGFAFEKMDITI